MLGRDAADLTMQKPNKANERLHFHNSRTFYVCPWIGTHDAELHKPHLDSFFSAGLRVPAHGSPTPQTQR